MIKNINIFLFLGCLLLSVASIAQRKVLFLWHGVAPGSQAKFDPERVRKVNGEYVISNIHKPSITIYLPDKQKSKHIAVIIAPGGGHRELWITHEGYNIAKSLCDRGIAAFVLKYRLAKDSNSTYTVDKDELADIQRAIRLIRYHANQWKIDSTKIGVMGFSAGGELAGLSAMKFDYGHPQDSDIVNRQSSKPDFQALIYPGNAERLEVVENIPPIFISAGFNDNTVGKIVALFLKYKAANLPAELHIYSNAGHGFGIRNTNNVALAGWINRFYDWLKEQDFL